MLWHILKIKKEESIFISALINLRLLTLGYCDDDYSVLTVMMSVEMFVANKMVKLI